MKRTTVSLLVNGTFWGCILSYLFTTSYLHSYNRTQPEVGTSGAANIIPDAFSKPAVASKSKLNPSSASSSSSVSGGTDVSLPSKEDDNNPSNVTSQKRQKQPQHKHSETAVETSLPQNHQGRNNTKVNRQPQPREPRKQHKQDGKIFWRYDDVGPKIKHATTHYLSSIPPQHRISLPPSVINFLTDQATDGSGKSLEKQFWDRYASDPNHVWPKKLHLFEMNPSIARLPEHYRTNEIWRSFFRELGVNLPHYVASYRVTHQNNCFDGETTLKLVGGSWRNNIPNDNYLGISLMDAELSILVDTTVDLKPIQNYRDSRRLSFPDYNDFRVFNLGEQLFLSSTEFISPIHLSLPEFFTTRKQADEYPQIPKKFVEIPPAFNASDPASGEHTTNNSPLRVWARTYSSCPVGASDNPKHPKRRRRYRHKNLLYFGGNTTSAKVLFYPRHNPNDIRNVNLKKPCNLRIRPAKEQIDNGVPAPNQPLASFETIEAIKYPNHTLDDLFLGDRGSACCTRVKSKSIRRAIRSPLRINATISQVTNATISNTQNDNDDELLVAIVHPKTIYPGKRLPTGVIPNIYLSKFIAFLPKEPFTIVARSGMFCLGNPRHGTDEPTKNPLQYAKLIPLRFANETYDCPRIHFATGMVDTPRPISRESNNTDDEKGSVIIAYGVSDCLSRFVKIRKTEIIRMLSSDA